VERDFVGVRVKAGGVIGARLVEKEKVQNSDSKDDKGEEKVESEEASQCGIVYRKTASDSLDEHLSDVGHG